MWLPESALILHLNKSRQYQRILICIYVMTLGLLWSSTGWMSLKIGMSVYLVIHGMRMVRAGRPTIQAMSLIYAADKWSWQTEAGQDAVELEGLTLLVYTDLFILLRLVAIKRRAKTVVIFQDQLTEAQLRRLMWIMYP